LTHHRRLRLLLLGLQSSNRIYWPFVAVLPHPVVPGEKSGGPFDVAIVDGRKLVSEIDASILRAGHVNGESSDNESRKTKQAAHVHSPKKALIH
jgi:hypothetical protein